MNFQLRSVSLTEFYSESHNTTLKVTTQHRYVKHNHLNINPTNLFYQDKTENLMDD